MHTLILGAGYSGRFIAAEAAHGGTVCGTRRTEAGVQELAAQDIPGVVLDGRLDDDMRGQLARVTHLVVSVAPRRELPLSDPMLELLGPVAGESGRDRPFGKLQWIGYLSTIGVYGDHGGDWVDETTACESTQARSQARREAEIAWQTLASQLQVPISTLRLSGIYGPGRNAVADAIAGRPHMLIKPGQFFNRIHVQDLASATMLAAGKAHDGVLNITDDQPAPPQDVIRYAHQLVGKNAPEERDFDTADISSMARSFYSENKRVRNALSKTALQLSYRYPNYRAGLDDIWQGMSKPMDGGH